MRTQRQKAKAAAWIIVILWSGYASGIDLRAGRVIGWGNNISGEATGVPTSGSSTGFVMIAGELVTNAVTVAAGRSHALALRSDGTVVGWGVNGSGEAVGFTTPGGYRANGVVKLSGRTLTDVAAISAGGNFSLAVRKDGSLVCWGGGIGTLPRTSLKMLPRLTSVASIAAGWDFNLALTSDHRVVGWGDREVPPGLSNIVSIALGAGTFAPAIVLRADGKVFEWAASIDSRGASLITTNAVAIAAGAGHGLALQQGGAVLGWGANVLGEAHGSATTESSVPCGPVVIDGQVLTHVAAISAGVGTSIALKDDGTLVAWGRTEHGLNGATVPREVKKAIAVAAGEDFFLAITEPPKAENGTH